MFERHQQLHTVVYICDALVGTIAKDGPVSRAGCMSVGPHVVSFSSSRVLLRPCVFGLQGSNDFEVLDSVLGKLRALMDSIADTDETRRVFKLHMSTTQRKCVRLCWHSERYPLQSYAISQLEILAQKSTEKEFFEWFDESKFIELFGI